MKRSLLALSILVALPAFAQVDQSGSCAPGTATCTLSPKNAGDVSTTTNGDTDSRSAQNGVSAAVNGATFNPSNTGKVQQDAAQNLSGNQSSTAAGGAATGGAAVGNDSRNDNRSSVGDTKSASGAISGTRGENTLRDSGNATQAQGIDRSGNSSVRGGNTSGTVTGTQALRDSGNSASRSASSADGAGTLAGAGAGSNNRTATTTRVDASDRSTYTDNSRLTILPPLIHGAPLPAAPGTRLDATVTECGPRVEVWLSPRMVLNKRVILPDELVQVGWTQYTRPAKPRFEIDTSTGRRLVIGHRKIVSGAPLTAGSASSLSGLGGNGNGFLQAGGSSAAQLQDITKDVEALECVMPEDKPAEIEVVYRDRIIYQEVPMKDGGQ